MTGNSCRHRANYKNKGVLEAETNSLIDVLHVGDALNYNTIPCCSFITETGVYLGSTPGWGAPNKDPGDSQECFKIRVPLTEILEIGVLEVLLTGVLLPSGPDNLAIGVPPVGELLRYTLTLL